jgi:hypothetical protein
VNPQTAIREPRLDSSIAGNGLPFVPDLAGKLIGT